MALTFNIIADSTPTLYIPGVPKIAAANLIKARTRLTELTKELSVAHPSMNSSSEARLRYLQLQEEWEIAFKAFGTAADEFTAAILRAKP